MWETTNKIKSSNLLCLLGGNEIMCYVLNFMLPKLATKIDTVNANLSIEDACLKCCVAFKCCEDINGSMINRAVVET